MANLSLSLILWPLISGLVLFCLGKARTLAQWLFLFSSVVWMVLVILAWSGANSSEASSSAFPLFYNWNWLPAFKSRFLLGLDGLNLPLIGLNAFLSLCLSFYYIGKEKINSAYLGLFSILNVGSVGSLMAADALTFYVFWEFMLIPMLFLIGKWGSKNRVYAALKFFAFTFAGSLLMLLAIVALVHQQAIPSLGWHDLATYRIPFDGIWSTQGLIFLGFLVAFLVKIPVWPLHTWLPDAHTEAPTGGSVILAGVLLKLGVYGIARWCLPLFPESAQTVGPVVMALGAIGVVLGSFAAWKQTDIKRCIAYSSVAHLGFMAIGVFSFVQEAFEGAMFQNIAHGLSTGLLFLIFGIIYDRTHSRELSEYGGMASKNPWLVSVFVLASMASVGLPGLPGFVGEFLILTGTYKVSVWIALTALSGVLLGSIYTLNLIKKMNFGKPSELVEHHPVVPTKLEWVAIVPFVVAMLVLGMRPGLLLGQAHKALEQVFLQLR